MVSNTFLCIPHPEDAQVVRLPSYDNFATIGEVIRDTLAKHHVADLLPAISREWIIYTPVDVLYTGFEEETLDGVRQWLVEHRNEKPAKLGDSVRTLLEKTGVREGYVSVIVTDAEAIEGLDTFVCTPIAPQVKVHRARQVLARKVNEQLPAPSSVVNHPGRVYEDAAEFVHAGHPYGNHGPSTALYDQTLGLLAYHLANLDGGLPELEPSQFECELIQKFSEDSLNTHTMKNEEEYRAKIAEYVAAFTGAPVAQVVSYGYKGVKGQYFTPDGIIGDKEMPSGIFESKREFGLSGDASLQAFTDYSKVVTQHKLDLKLRRSNIATVLLSVMGNFIEMAGTMFTDGAYMTTFFSQKIDLTVDPDALILRLTRAFKALGICIHSLSQSRVGLAGDVASGQETLTHLLPSPLPVPTCTSEKKRIISSLEFIGRLRRDGSTIILAENSNDRTCKVYVATLPRSFCVSSGLSAQGDPAERVEVIVKFARRYNLEAHRMLAAIGRAPALHACVPVCDQDGSTMMVVMDRVVGRSVFALRRDTPDKPLSRAVYEDVKKAIETLHASDIVFGDLRTPNIMVVDSGDGSRGMLVDFDWAGKHGVARYTVTLNRQTPNMWAEGVQPYGLMKKEHDVSLLNELETLCR